MVWGIKHIFGTINHGGVQYLQYGIPNLDKIPQLSQEQWNFHGNQTWFAGKYRIYSWFSHKNLHLQGIFQPTTFDDTGG